jgi:membrane-associated phospholipid phosphatase
MVLLKAPLDMFYLMACYVVNSCVMMLISRKWKISVHASGVSGPATFLVHQYGASVWPFLILSFIICWARWRLNMHTYNQLIAGLVLTALLTYVQLEFYIGFTPPL